VTSTQDIKPYVDIYRSNEKYSSIANNPKINVQVYTKSNGVWNTTPTKQITNSISN